MLETSYSLAFELHTTGLTTAPNGLWARCQRQVLSEGQTHIDLIPTLIPSDLYRVNLATFEPNPQEGWVTVRAGLEINCHHLGFKPLAFYVGEPTDWCSGLARFEVRPDVPYGQDPLPIPVFTLGVRRAS